MNNLVNAKLKKAWQLKIAYVKRKFVPNCVPYFLPNFKDSSTIFLKLKPILTLLPWNSRDATF